MHDRRFLYHLPYDTRYHKRTLHERYTNAKRTMHARYTHAERTIKLLTFKHQGLYRETDQKSVEYPIS